VTTALNSDLDEFEQNLLTCLAHVAATYLFAVSQHAITTEKLRVCPPDNTIQ